MSRPFDPHRWRTEYPAFGRQVGGQPAAFLDGPAGSQVPRRVIDAVAGYMAEINANTGGHFATSLASGEMLDAAHRGAADFLGVDDADLVVFGPNMTTLTLQLADALRREWRPGDELLLTHLEHDANFTPWVLAAAESGAVIREVEIVRRDCTLDLEDLASKLNERTRLVAICAASNAVGTVPPLAQVVEMAHAAGAAVFVDAVHFAPHRLIEARAWDCDFVVCSAYKFFGPHVAFMWGKRELLERLPVRRLRPVGDRPPASWMPGTPSHEGIAGALEAIEYLADIGREHAPQLSNRRAALEQAFDAIGEHERLLGLRALQRLAEIPELRVWGITDPEQLDQRVPTFSFTHERHTADEIARHLGRRGIFVWHGNFYALPVTQTLGLEPDGLVRVGLLHYNTEQEIDRLGSALAEL